MKVLEYLLGVASVVLSDSESECPRTSYNPSESNYYSYYLFRLQFPGSYCQTSYCSESLQQKLLPNSFKIHGLWPSTGASEGPSYCRDMQFDPSELGSSLLQTMDEYWPSDRGANNCFWSHEWEKHGVCVQNVPGHGSGYLTENSFFSLVMSTFDKYNPTTVLKNANIVPDNNYYYTPETINTALKNAYGVLPSYTCQESNGKTWFMSLSLCLDLDLNPRDCPSSSTCNSGKIYFGEISAESTLF